MLSLLHRVLFNGKEGSIYCVTFDPSGTRLGTVAGVLANPASDLLELDSGALVPLRFVVERSTGRVVVDAPDGLFDLPEH